MATDTYYLLTALPSLGSLGDSPPLSLHDMLDQVADLPAARELIEAVLIGDDLLQREAGLAGELTDLQPTVLTAEQLQDEAPLPDYLVGDDDADAPYRVAGDRLWAAYFRHMAAVAHRRRSSFLAEWVGLEVTLRNTLVEVRAKALDLPPESYLVATDLDRDDLDLTTMINEWSSARDPLAGLRALDNARWRWLDENDHWFSFATDELAAYAVKLMLLHRWIQLTEPHTSETGAETP